MGARLTDSMPLGSQAETTQSTDPSSRRGGGREQDVTAMSSATPTKLRSENATIAGDATQAERVVRRTFSAECEARRFAAEILRKLSVSDETLRL